MSKQRMVLLGCGILGILSVFLPWAAMMGISVSGIKTDAWWLVLILSAAIIIFSLLGERTEAIVNRNAIIILVLGALQAIFAVCYIINIASNTTEVFGETIGGSPQLGIFLVLLTGVGAVAFGKFVKLK